MKFAQRVFLIAGIYGLVVLLPQYFLESKTGRDSPLPEYYCGFIGVAVAWQILFLCNRSVVKGQSITDLLF